MNARTKRDDKKRRGSRLENGLIAWDNRRSGFVSVWPWQHSCQVRARAPKQCCTSVGCKPSDSPGLRAGCGLKPLIRSSETARSVESRNAPGKGGNGHGLHGLGRPGIAMTASAGRQQQAISCASRRVSAGRKCRCAATRRFLEQAPNDGGLREKRRQSAQTTSGFDSW